MVKKKISAVLGAALIISAVPGMVFAEEDDGATSVVVDGDSVIVDQNGEPVLYANGEGEVNANNRESQIRLRDGSGEGNNSKLNTFQNRIRSEYMFTSLSNRIDLQVESARVIADKATELEMEVDFSEIIQNMEALIIEIDAYVFDEEEDSEIVKLEFDTFRDEAKNLTEEFKILAKDLFTEEEKEEIKEELKEVKKANIEKHKANIQARKAEIQIEGAKNFLERMGVDSSEVLDKIESGEITEDQIKEALKELYMTLKDDKKKDLVQKYKEEKTKKSIAVKEKREQNKEKIEASKKRIEQKREQNKKRFEENKKRIEEKKREIKNKIAERKENIKNNAGAQGFSSEQIAIIDSDIAEKLENEEITLQEARIELKKILDEMSVEERNVILKKVGVDVSKLNDNQFKNIKNIE